MDSGTAVRQRALQDLTRHWSDDEGHAAYLFRYEGGRYYARRADDGRELSAATPGELRVLVADDYAAFPVRVGRPEESNDEQ